MESLMEKFNIDKLDVETRSLAALCIDGELYIGKTHIAAMRCFDDKMKTLGKTKVVYLSLKHATLHIILNKGIRYFFIEKNSLLTNIKADEIIQQIQNKYKKPFEVYNYFHKKGIELIFKNS